MAISLMQNKKLVILLFLYTVVSHAQTAIQVNYVFTPKGKEVPDTWVYDGEMAQEDLSLYNGLVNNLVFPTAQIIQGSTNSYNCHAYAWHTSEGGSSVWIGLTSWDSEDVYMDNPINGGDSSYIEWCEEIYPAKVSYTSGDHSAITSGTSGYFYSKWGYGPLVYHHKDDVPYDYAPNGATYKYYIRAPYIIGASAICGAKTFTMSSLPVGLSIAWSVSGNISIPTNSTGLSVVVTPTGSSGSGNLTATITSSCNPVVVEKEITIGASAFNSVMVSGASALCADAEQYSLANLPSGSTVGWSVLGGISIQGSATGNTVTVISTTTVGSGAGKITATIENCPPKDKYVTTGVAALPVISGDNVICQYSVLNPYEASSVPYALEYNWSMQPGPQDLQLSGNGNSQISIYTGTAGSYYLMVEVPTLCGTAYSDLFPIEVISDLECMGMMGRFTVSPNPSDGAIEIKQIMLDEKYSTINHSFDVVLHDKDGDVLSRLSSTDGNEIKLETRHLKEGNYYLRLRQDKDVIVRQVIVKH